MTVTEPVRPFNYASVRCRPYKKRIIVDLQKNFLYCPVPKAANTAWKSLLASYVPADIRLIHAADFAGFQYLSSLSNEAFLELKDALFKFIFVRSPLSRLLSAYINKFEKVASREVKVPFWSGYARFIKNRVQELGLGEKTDELTFREFVIFVCSQEFKEMDEHWHSQVLLACLNEFEYDFIGKFENLAEHTKVVLARLGIAKPFPTHAETRFAPTGASDLLSAYYTPELEKMVREKFACDFERFKY